MAFWNRPSGNFTTKQVGTNASTGTRIIGKNESRLGLVLKNMGTTGETVYLGATEEVASTTGFPLGPGESVAVPSRAAVYGRSATGTPKVAVMSTGSASLGGLLNA